MRLIRQKLKRAAALILAASLLCVVPVIAGALPKASITIFYHGVTSREENIALSGAAFSLYRVASNVGRRWEFQGDFTECTVPLTDMSASGQLQAARGIYAYAREKNLEGLEQTTDTGGRTTFAGLEEGLYLLVPMGDVTCSGGVFRSAPFLTGVPEVDKDGNPIYDVTVEPKNEWVPEEETEEETEKETEEPQTPAGEPEEPQTPAGEPEEPQTPAGEPEMPADEPDTETEAQPGGGSSGSPGNSSPTGNVKTGDDTPVLPYAGILAVSGAAALVLWIGRRKKKLKDE